MNLSMLSELSGMDEADVRDAFQYLVEKAEGLGFNPSRFEGKDGKDIGEAVSAVNPETVRKLLDKYKSSWIIRAASNQIVGVVLSSEDSRAKSVQQIVAKTVFAMTGQPVPSVEASAFMPRVVIPLIEELLKVE